jgi:hypothetical protein
MLEIIKAYSDILIMLCSLVFSVSLIPTTLNNFRKKICEIPYKTSIPTASGLYLLVFVYMANGWQYSELVGLLSAIMWTIIALQRRQYYR